VGITLKDAGDFLLYLGGIAAALTAIGLVVRFAVLKPLVNHIKEQVSPPLDKVYSEVRHNGGKTMKDQLTSVDKKLTLLSKRLDEHLENHK
jgi:hypothetical protein